MPENNRIVSPEKINEDNADSANPVSLRPNSLAEFVGQRAVCDNLKVFIEAAKVRGDALDHVLLFGPPGLGKTTLASIIAKELGVGFRATSGCVVVEPDQRAWVVYPTNAFGGVVCSFPKGRLEPVLSLAQNAAKETWEESGLLVRPVHFLCDIVRRHVVTRFYLALRITGSPVLAGWESQAVGLVPVDDLTLFLNREYDRKVVPYVAALLSNSASLFSSFGKALQQP